jgi:hydrogenase maturation factor
LKGLPLGKLPIEILKGTVLRMTGAPSKKVMISPKAGADFALIRLRRGCMVVSSDPITGVVSNIGRYAVNVSANDIATSGNRPQFMESVVLLPEGTTRKELETIANQIHTSAKNLGISIVGGHTEVTPRLDRPIIMVTAFSFVDDFVSSDGARVGDSMLITKTAGLEGTVIIAGESARLGLGIPKGLVRRAEVLEKNLSVVEEGVAAFKTGHVHAMHDCTEGGVLGAAYEMSLVSDVGFELDEGKVPVAAETREICNAVSADPLRLIGSGSLLLAVESSKVDKVMRVLRRVSSATEIGRFTAKGNRVLRRADGAYERVATAPTDELWKVIGAQ